MCPSPTACFLIVISREALKKNEKNLWEYVGELQERGKLGSLHLVGLGVGNYKSGAGRQQFRCKVEGSRMAEK